MASYTVNQQALARARQLIDARQYVLKSSWNDIQPSADDENTFLESHSWEEYASGTWPAPPTVPRPGTPSSTATSAASTAWA